MEEGRRDPPLFLVVAISKAKNPSDHSGSLLIPSFPSQVSVSPADVSRASQKAQ
jgi:hypothetical protein